MTKNMNHDDVKFDYMDTTAVVGWLSAGFSGLEFEGQIVVDEYWKRFKAMQKGRSASQRASLGVRVRTRRNGAFSLEWYVMGVIGKNRKPVEKQHIPKGQANRYSIDLLLAAQPNWIGRLVEETEELLAEIRLRQSLLIDIRNSVGAYTAEFSGQRQTGSQLLEHFRLTQQAGSKGDVAVKD